MTSPLGELSIDFRSDHKNYLRPLRGRAQELLSRALGAGKDGLRVLDGTAGLAQDAVMLARLGFEVTAIEQNEKIFVLLEQALTEVRNSDLREDWVDRLNFQFSSLQSWSAQSRLALGIDVIYLDPMFPEKKKSALPPLRMQIFQLLLGHENEEDSRALLLAALNIPANRVVLKRANKAPPLLAGVIHSYQGSKVRYDLYKKKL